MKCSQLTRGIDVVLQLKQEGCERVEILCSWCRCPAVMDPVIPHHTVTQLILASETPTVGPKALILLFNA
jgi:hypothetical protein